MMLSKLIKSMVLSTAFVSSIANAEILESYEVNLEPTINNNSLSSKEKAEALISEGERLLTPTSFMISQSLFNAALLFDKTNDKAIFYNKILSPLMVFRGIIGRAKPLVKSASLNEMSHYNEIKSNLSKGEVADFFINSEEAAIKSESDVQALLNDFTRKIELLRDYLKSNRGKKITLNVGLKDSEGAAFDLSSPQYKRCVITRNGALAYSFKNCDIINNSVSINVERADMEMLLGIASGLQVINVLSTAYEVNGVAKLATAIKRKEDKLGHSLSDKEYAKMYNSLKNAGKLYKGNQLVEIPNLASDILMGAKWAKANEDMLCETKTYGYEYNGSSYAWKERVGIKRDDALFGNGVCVNPEDKTEFANLVDKVELALAGGIITETVKKRKNGTVIQTMQTRVKYIAPFESPVKNLKNILPTKFNDCGMAQNVGDDTFLGVFVDGDANKVMKFSGQIDPNEKPYWCNK